jgi:hypothetical protein
MHSIDWLAGYRLGNGSVRRHVNNRDWSLIACLKKRLTPMSAFAFLRSSLMTLVSIKYIHISNRILHPFEIGIPARARYRCQRFSKTPPGRQQQQCFEQSAVFGFRTPAIPRGSFLECVHDTLIKVSDDEICHGDSPFQLKTQ